MVLGAARSAPLATEGEGGGVLFFFRFAFVALVVFCQFVHVSFVFHHMVRLHLNSIHKTILIYVELSFRLVVLTMPNLDVMKGKA